jgi:superfamily II DNA/RNA helicase
MAQHAHTRPHASTDARPRPDASARGPFQELGVPARLEHILAEAGIDEPFPIQTATLPDTLAGRDVLGRGRTGSGKTLAFALPMVARLAANHDPERRRPGRPRALILAPTRELVTQINQTVMMLTKPYRLRTVTVFGGVGAGHQIEAFKKGVDVVIACPGRLEDHLVQHNLRLDDIEITVLDEADHMADLGFLPGVKRILDRTPVGSQRLLFSATLDNGIDVLVDRYLERPVTHSVDSEQSPVDTMEHHVLHVENDDRLPVLVDLASAPGRTMIFTRTKHRAKLLTRQLVANGVPAVEMHGNLAQTARTRNLAAFSEGRATALVATDIAARGIHVDDVSLVIHADPPVEHKAYLHRSGRTARAGNDGTVVTLATREQRRDVKQLAHKAGIKPTITEARVGDAVLTALAPGARSRLTPAEIAEALPVPPVQQPSKRGPKPARSSAPKRDDKPNAGRPRNRRPKKQGAASAPAGGGRRPGNATRRAR